MPQPNSDHPTHAYARSVAAGDTPSGRLVRLACERHLDDLARGGGRGLWFDAEAADLAFRFIGLLRFSKGRWGGQPFVLQPWQHFLIGSLFGWKREDGTRRFREGHLEVARKNGKTEIAAAVGLKLMCADGEAGAECYCLAPLALDTPIPTPTGWTTMGAIAPGDEVFDEGGRVCRVVGVSPVYADRDCYRVRFSDGSEVVADGDHLWTVDSVYLGRSKAGIPRDSRPRFGRTLTTRELAQSARTPWGVANHSIPAAGELELPAADLPIPPYTLGVWLGDGRNNRGAIVHAHADREIRSGVEAEGFRTSVHGGADGLLRYTVLGLRGLLRRLGLLGNKHVPAAYLRASRAQRLELLRGLLDTDGTCTKRGEVRFTNRVEGLARAVYELLAGLGLIPHIRSVRVAGAPHWIVSCSTNGTALFRLSRKAARQVTPTKMARRRRIVAVEPVPSVPVRCIAVDSASHLFLVGRGFIATHNTKRDQAKTTFNVATKLLRKSPIRGYLRTLKTAIHHEDSGSKLEPLGADANTLDSLNVHGSIKDELHAWKSRDLWDVIDTATGARSQPLGLVTTTAGHNRRSIWWERRELCRKVLEGAEGYENDELFALIYTPDDGDDWEDELVWHKGNPSLGPLIRLDELRQRARDAKQTPGGVNAFRRLRLNQPTETATRWLNMALWRAAADPIPEDQLRGRTCFGGLDLSSTTDLTAWALVFPPSAADRYWRLLVRHWLPAEDIGERETRDRAPYRQWAGGTGLVVCQGGWVDYESVRLQIEADRRAFRLVSLAFDSRFAPPLVQQLMAAGVECVPWGQGYLSLNTPTKEFGRLLLARELRHQGCPLLEWEAENAAIEQDAAGNYKPSKGKSSQRIDGIAASINSLGLAIEKWGEGGPVDAGVYEIDLDTLGAF